MSSESFVLHKSTVQQHSLYDIVEPVKCLSNHNSLKHDDKLSTFGLTSCFSMLPTLGENWDSTIRENSRITPVPKVIHASCVERDFRPISITCPIACVAERVVASFFDEHFDSHQDPNQFGVTRERSTTLALVKLCHFIFSASDDSFNFINILFVDFTKAFDLIEHGVLYNKFVACDFPSWLTSWYLSFLNNRQQFVKCGNACSSVLVTNCGAPQGTRAGGNAFKLLINDLNCDANTIKYVDDVSLATVSSDPCSQQMQVAVNSLHEWCLLNSLHININKTKAMTLHFGKKFDVKDCPNLLLNDTIVERVVEYKLLGVIIRADLNWSSHVNYMISKASKRIYVLTMLARIRISAADLLTVYCSILRPLLEYASPVWHCGISKTQSNEIERVQKRCFKIIFPFSSYREALNISGLERLSARRERAAHDLFQQIKQPTHILHSLITVKEKSDSAINTRESYPFVVPRPKTNRLSKSLVAYGLFKKW